MKERPRRLILPVLCNTWKNSLGDIDNKRVNLLENDEGFTSESLTESMQSRSKLSTVEDTQSQNMVAKTNIIHIMKNYSGQDEDIEEDYRNGKGTLGMDNMNIILNLTLNVN